MRITASLEFFRAFISESTVIGPVQVGPYIIVWPSVSGYFWGLFVALSKISQILISLELVAEYDLRNASVYLNIGVLLDISVCPSE